MPKSWPTALGSAFAVIAVISLGVESLGTPIVAAALAVLGLVPLVGDWREVREDLHDLNDVKQPIPDVAVDGDWELMRYPQGRMIVSPSVDRNLDRPFVVSSRTYKLPPDLAAVKPAVIALARSKRSRAASQPFDGFNVRLCEDLDAAGSEVRLQPARYFDTMASNYLAGQAWWSKRLHRVVADVTRNIMTDSGKLIPLAHSGLANQIGISTIALTTDGSMLLVHQGPAARSSGGLVAPSGSGSLEPADLAGCSSLVEAIAAGMERELREELGLGRAEMRGVVIDTEVVGFGRWLEKGAKPEFVGISWIHATERDLDTRIDLSERQFVADHLHIPPQQVDRLLAGERFENLGVGLPSVPLELCLARWREREQSVSR
ncbi:hypothetical protein E0H75_06280 [Kribbella capetownensis]|uniref:Nudix hydrolase domain-containing protein n=1 Tax=Kribbella capetownensis TaxID=1572659 RepID=A0A4R0K097_9ACTN|nr:hypothetical protein [Kribbella capetownensis]TCC53313.1 hypothetical protein E0H75_06280 [Kribbella capetownensis]